MPPDKPLPAKKAKTGRPRSVKAFEDGLAELKKWLAESKPPEEFAEEWYAGLCGGPRDFTQQLVKLRDALQTAGQTVSPER